MGISTDLVVRVVHIFFGVFWAGAAFILAGFIEPAVKSMGPEGGRFVERLMGPGRFGIFMTLAGILVVLSGAAMLWRGSGPDLSMWLRSPSGRSIALGSTTGVLALVIGLGVNAPTAGRIARLAGEARSASGPPPAELLSQITRLQHRLHVAGVVAAVLLGVTVVAMAAAHFL